MPRTTAHVTISLDGFMAGPDQRADEPLGTGGETLHRWMFEPAGDGDRAMRDRLGRQKGAYVMGRHMFAGPGTWDADWRGWWGEEPPYHAPVFVVTSHAREPLELTGTTFHFVPDGFDAAYARAADEAAGEGDVGIAGGASVLRQALAAGVVDELTLDVAPILLGGGVRPLDGLPTGVRFEPVEVVPSPLATHIVYRVTAA